MNRRELIIGAAATVAAAAIPEPENLIVRCVERETAWTTEPLVIRWRAVMTVDKFWTIKSLDWVEDKA